MMVRMERATARWARTARRPAPTPGRRGGPGGVGCSQMVAAPLSVVAGGRGVWWGCGRREPASPEEWCGSEAGTSSAPGDEGDVFGNLLAVVHGLAGDSRAHEILEALRAARVAHTYPILVVTRPIVRDHELWRSSMERHQQNRP